MKKFPNYSESLSETLKKSDLSKVGLDLAETILDSTLQNGILKDIPILGSLVGIGKTVSTVKDVLFLKKVLSFINEVKDIPPYERMRIISKIDDSEQYRLKIGEKLLYILDKAEDHEKTLFIGKLFRAFLSQEIDYDIFLRGSAVIDKSIAEDLDWFIKHDWEKLSIEEAGEYINWGLFEIEPLSIKVKEGYEKFSNWEPESNYTVEGGKLSAKITWIGKKIRQYLR